MIHSILDLFHDLYRIHGQINSVSLYCLLKLIAVVNASSLGHTICLWHTCSVVLMLRLCVSVVIMEFIIE